MLNQNKSDRKGVCAEIWNAYESGSVNMLRDPVMEASFAGIDAGTIYTQTNRYKRYKAGTPHIKPPAGFMPVNALAELQRRKAELEAENAALHARIAKIAALASVPV